MNRLRTFGESLVSLSDERVQHNNTGGPNPSLIDEHGQSVELEDIGSRLGHPDKDDRVLLDIAWGRLGPTMSRICELCDRVYFLVSPQDMNTIRQWVAALSENSPEVVERLRWVWCLDAREHVALLLPGLAKVAGKDLKLHLPNTEGANSRVVEQGLVRLFHDLRGVSLWIALAGGAARGMAHPGVLQSLEDAGIVFDAISGTGAGAMAKRLWTAEY